MIPEINAIQDRLALGLITEHEAEELFFLIHLVDRDYRLSASKPSDVHPEMKDGIAHDFHLFIKNSPALCSI